ncbi:MAG: hypothetical protein GDA51_07430 [Ekhidna sp.]|nr:hypothetical protein [Ekhidna sp.]
MATRKSTFHGSPRNVSPLFDGTYLLRCSGACNIPEYVSFPESDTREGTADGNGVCSCFSVGMGSISSVGFVIGRFVFPPFYGVAVGFSADSRNGNGFVRSFRLPCGDEGFRVVLRPS